MINQMFTQLASLVTTFATAVGNIVMLPPVAVTLGIMVVGLAVGFVRKLSGGRKGRARKRG